MRENYSRKCEVIYIYFGIRTLLEVSVSWYECKLRLLTYKKITKRLKDVGMVVPTNHEIKVHYLLTTYLFLSSTCNPVDNKG